MKPPKKTNAARILDTNGISYELRTYEVDESDLSGVTVAKKVGLPPAQVFKTLVARGDRAGVVIACIPSDAELDLKALATACGSRKAELVPLRDVQKLTGYIRGGVSPVGTSKPYPVYLDESTGTWPVIALSAGIRGCQMLVRPADIAAITQATVVTLTR